MTPLLFFVIAVGFSTVASRHVNFYRKDYTFMDEFDAFYKLHWDTSGTDWSSTFLACDDEGAELFYPKIRDEWTVIKKLVKTMAHAPNVSDIFVGIHDKFGVGEFITINGSPTSAPILNLETSGEGRCVTLNIETGVLEANECLAQPGISRPFVCKKVEDVSCPTIEKGYRYFRETRKCYKVNNKEMNWSRAMETCFMEGGMLVVVESELEASIIRQKVLLDYNNNIYHAGFKKIFPNKEYYTVKGHQLSDTGYERWYSSNNEECGVIRDGNNDLLSSVKCDKKLPFVCEMNVTV
ncbi:hypothetical protein ABMA28_004130 [Loxostege sticticalis]|uniref:C-type lectin domain-containing protein n=1 Tax=Loxostege sticticalis TaxID=481309 RepID=A0ABD0SUH8_LOXSC